jgi:hypothetical protein
VQSSKHCVTHSHDLEAAVRSTSLHPGRRNEPTTCVHPFPPTSAGSWSYLLADISPMASLGYSVVLAFLLGDELINGNINVLVSQVFDYMQ